MVKSSHILLVNPACQDKRITDDDARHVAIGLYYIAAHLKKNGFSVSLLNLADEPVDPFIKFSEYIEQNPVDLIGFSITNPSRICAVECAKIFKKINPDVPVVFGGPAATFLSEHLFQACPELDIIIPGEGELSFLELAMALKNDRKETLSDINGLIIKQENLLFTTPAREPIHDLDVLAHPAEYFQFNHISMSRGCPGKCTFCGSPKFWSQPGVRYHSVEWMIKEIQLLFARGIQHFYFSDDTFTMDKKKVIELCKRMIELNLPITWNAISRVDHIDEDRLYFMRKAGCIQISYGVESGSIKIRKILGKPIDQTTIITAFKQTLEHGILPRAYFIYGSPGETTHTIDQSIELMKQISPLSMVTYILMLYPGTYLYDHAKNKGWLSDDIWFQQIEDIPWFEIDNELDFPAVQEFGKKLRDAFHKNIGHFAKDIKLIDNKDLYPSHADFLSRLGMTFSHGEYADHPLVNSPIEIAEKLYVKALTFTPDTRAFLGLGMLYQKLRKFNHAVQILEKGLTSSPQHPDLMVCLGVCLMNMKQFDRALTIFNQIKKHTNVDQYIDICHQHT